MTDEVNATQTASNEVTTTTSKVAKRKRASKKSSVAAFEKITFTLDNVLSAKLQNVRDLARKSSRSNVVARYSTVESSIYNLLDFAITESVRRFEKAKHDARSSQIEVTRKTLLLAMSEAIQKNDIARAKKVAKQI